jgi:hypothetical protein
MSFLVVMVGQVVRLGRGGQGGVAGHVAAQEGFPGFTSVCRVGLADRDPLMRSLSG